MFFAYIQLYSNVLVSMKNLWKHCWYLIKFELSIIVIWSGPVDNVAVFQIAEYKF